jgi:hypothetical protein
VREILEVGMAAVAVGVDVGAAVAAVVVGAGVEVVDLGDSCGAF